MYFTRALCAIAVGSIALGLLAAGTAAHADAKRGGDVTFVDPATGRELRSGGSQTTWTLKLPRPPASNCSGDSARDGHFIYTYMVSDSVSPATLTFNPDQGVAPVPGKVAYPLIDNFGRPYISRNAAPDTGQILPGTGFTFSRLSLDGNAGGKLTPGTYNVGMACWDANDRAGDKFWNAKVTFTTSSSDPSGLAWRTTPGADAPESSGFSPLAVALPVAGVAATAGIVVRRRARSAVR